MACVCVGVLLCGVVFAVDLQSVRWVLALFCGLIGDARVAWLRRTLQLSLMGKGRKQLAPCCSSGCRASAALTHHSGGWVPGAAGARAASSGSSSCWSPSSLRRRCRRCHRCHRCRRRYRRVAVSSPWWQCKRRSAPPPNRSEPPRSHSRAAAERHCSCRKCAAACVVASCLVSVYRRVFSRM